MFHFFVQNPQNKQHYSKKNHESEESDSDDLDQLTSSRTESSNQMEGKAKHGKSYYLSIS